MFREIKRAAGMLVILSAITGMFYPLAMTGVAQVLFPFQANGSIITKDGAPIGSELIGQNFSSPGYFHSRPSAAGKDGYDAASSSGSNLGPTNKKFIDGVADNLKKVREENGMRDAAPVPSDLALASGSGLDPHISPDAAYIQVERIARERGLSSGEVRKLVEDHVETRQLGILGEPRVNTLKLNLALDKLK